MLPLARLPPESGSCDRDLCVKTTLKAMALSANIPFLFLNDPDQGLQSQMGLREMPLTSPPSTPKAL